MERLFVVWLILVVVFLLAVFVMKRHEDKVSLPDESARAPMFRAAPKNRKPAEPEYRRSVYGGRRG